MLELDKGYINDMVTHALEEDPNECCGILAGPQSKVVKLYRITNTEHSPYRYNMDPRELFLAYRDIENNGWELLAIYHSHTHSPAYPSATDVRLASWADALYILVSLIDHENPVVRAFQIADGTIAEQELLII